MSAFASAVLFCGAWVPVTPATVMQPAPVFCASAYSVKWPDKTANNPLPPDCAIRENGKVVGYRTNCKQGNA